MFRNYLAAALRNLERNSLYAGVTIAGLAIGFAAAMLIGLYVRDELTYDQFVPNHERVFRISETIVMPGERPIESDVGPAFVGQAMKLDFPQIAFQARLTGFDLPPTVRHGDFSAAEQNLAWADPDFFRVMPLPTIAGDLATSLDAPDSIVITRAIARKYFGRDTPVGETLLVDGKSKQVTAVLEDLPSNTHLVANLFASGRAADSVISQREKVDTSLNNTMATYIRLRPGQSVASIQPQLAGFVARHFGGLGKTRVTMHLVPLTGIHLHPSTQGAFKPAADPAILAAIAAVGLLIVLVAAINFVTLMTARASRRAVEVGVRKAAGATRRDLIVQFMGEAFVYVLLSVVLALALAEALLPAFNAFLQRKIAFDYLHDWRLAGGIAAVTVVTALLAGVYPAFVLSSFRPSAVLKGGLVVAAGGGRGRQGLVVVQFAILVTLVLVAVTIARQTLYAINEGMRVDKDQVVFMAAKPCTETMRDAMRAVPGVLQAACGSAQVLDPADADVKDEAVVDGRHTTVALAPVDFGFFEVYRIHPIAGRLFDPHRAGDGYQAGAEANPPLVINETALHKLGFASPAAALGRSVTWHFHTDLDAPYGHDPARPSEIIGVVPDFTFGSMRAPISATMYMVGPKTGYDSIALNLRLDGRRIPEALSGIDRVWKRVGGGETMQRYFVGQFMLRLYLDTIIQGATIAIAAIIALSIACLGLFALSAYTTERRTKEIGIRKAMGASSSDILRLLVWQFTKPVLWANLIAWPTGALVMSWWLRGFAYHVGLAPWTFVAAAAGALVIAWATVFVHALRVARAKPVGALRYE